MGVAMLLTGVGFGVLTVGALRPVLVHPADQKQASAQSTGPQAPQPS
jgi:hypothetical protein